MPRPKAPKKTSARALEDLGLSENEAALYELMLAKPRSSVQELTSRAPFPRTLLYYVLKRLEERGLVRGVRGKGRTVFVAENPERLHDLLAEREREFARSTEAVRELIPQLASRYRLASERPSVRVFEGIEEYRKALESLAASATGEVLAYEPLGEKRAGKETREAQDRRRVSKKRKKRILFFETAAALAEVKARAYDDYTEFRSLKKTLAPFSADLMLFDKKLLYTSASGAEEPTAVLIEDAALYEMQKSLFERAWGEAADRTLAYTERA